MRIRSLESGLRIQARVQGPRCLQGKQEGRVGTGMNWMATTRLVLLLLCREAGLMWPHRLVFQEKPQS